MDPITAAILAAIAAGAAAGATDVAKKAFVDAYGALKSLLKHKYGDMSDVAQAAESVEARPDSQARKDLLKEEVARVKADQDPELVAAAQTLLQKVGKLPGGQQLIQNIAGDHNIQVAGSGNVINVNQPPASEKKT
ncbi:MAG: hypothetical protein WCF84_22400 [Anaerolineae bacterium]